MRFITEEQEHLIKTMMYMKKIQIQELPRLIGGSRATWTKKLLGKIPLDAEDMIKLRRLLNLTNEQTLQFFLNFSLCPEIQAFK